MSMQMTAARRSAGEGFQYRLLYAICFSIFLIAAAVRKALPWRWFRRAGGTMRQSIFAQARNAASICATYVFMV